MLKSPNKSTFAHFISFKLMIFHRNQFRIIIPGEISNDHSGVIISNDQCRTIEMKWYDTRNAPS